MTSITDRVEIFKLHERPVGIVLSDDILLSQAIAATAKYAGYAVLLSRAGTVTLQHIDATTELTDSEWAVIRPLFMLYVERENAIYLEASRGLGLDVYGRTVAEVTMDIVNFELELPKLAFYYPIITV